MTKANYDKCELKARFFRYRSGRTHIFLSQ